MSEANWKVMKVVDQAAERKYAEHQILVCNKWASMLLSASASSDFMALYKWFYLLNYFCLSCWLFLWGTSRFCSVSACSLKRIRGEVQVSLSSVGMAPLRHPFIQDGKLARGWSFFGISIDRLWLLAVPVMQFNVMRWAYCNITETHQRSHFQK